jgi:hypothetical protein
MYVFNTAMMTASFYVHRTVSRQQGMKFLEETSMEVSRILAI